MTHSTRPTEPVAFFFMDIYALEMARYQYGGQSRRT
jgi:hypothetical protein